LPSIDNILGVRLPPLRKLAKAIAKEDWHSFTATADNEYFEEVMLQGIVIGYAKADIEEILRYVVEFVPKLIIGLCDSFCSGFKFTKDNMRRVWDFIQPFLISKEEYAVRFGIVILLDFYVNEEYMGYSNYWII
jgi:3-methyladenine DNA glycosylase AlkD